ncbi:branched-chain amino acid ABC transporter permease [Hamadaea tsunoensis]|uniref:branched-chain amino acid ABC transporter permease n=1 Tax=Hamadaea tsunoensis TaxID=53368 RepID=UPI00041736AE|nr:branched-chain amino acid ABC transporter permease [Hamadaea tsunoensis]
MAQSPTAAASLPKSRLRLSAYGERVAAYTILAAVFAWLVVNFLDNPQQFLSAAVFGISNGALYALIALGYSLVYGIIELINFAHGDLFMLGTLFSGFIITVVFGSKAMSAMGWVAFLVALVLVILFCASINMSIEFLAYRRLRHAPKLAPLITAVGMSFVLQFVGLKWNGSTQKSQPSVLPQGYIDLGGVRIYTSFLIVLAVTIPILGLMTWIVTKTRMGKAMRATAQDQDAARLMGVNVNRIISFTFGIGGALAGVAGLMYEQTVGTTRYDLGLQLGLIAFTAAVLGGIGSLPGAVLGGVLIGLIQGLNEGVRYGAGQRWTQSVVFSILILFMVFKPTGLMGVSMREKV